MKNDIIQDRFGWFYRDRGDGTYDSLSDDSISNDTISTGRYPRVARIDNATVLVRCGARTQAATSGFALRAAVALSKRRYRDA